MVSSITRTDNYFSKKLFLKAMFYNFFDDEWNIRSMGSLMSNFMSINYVLRPGWQLRELLKTWHHLCINYDGFKIEYSRVVYGVLVVQKPTAITHIQLTTHQWIQTTPYVCNERIFGGLLFTFNKIFLKNPLPRFVAHSGSGSDWQFRGI